MASEASLESEGSDEDMLHILNSRGCFVLSRLFEDYCSFSYAMIRGAYHPQSSGWYSTQDWNASDFFHNSPGQPQHLINEGLLFLKDKFVPFFERLMSEIVGADIECVQGNVTLYSAETNRMLNNHHDGCPYSAVVHVFSTDPTNSGIHIQRNGEWEWEGAPNVGDVMLIKGDEFLHRSSEQQGDHERCVVVMFFSLRGHAPNAPPLDAQQDIASDIPGLSFTPSALPQPLHDSIWSTLQSWEEAVVKTARQCTRYAPPEEALVSECFPCVTLSDGRRTLQPLAIRNGAASAGQTHFLVFDPVGADLPSFACEVFEAILPLLERYVVGFDPEHFHLSSFECNYYMSSECSLAAHQDPGDVSVALSFGAPASLCFRARDPSERVKEFRVEAQTAMVLTGEAHEHWEHYIPCGSVEGKRVSIMLQFSRKGSSRGTRGREPPTVHFGEQMLAARSCATALR